MIYFLSRLFYKALLKTVFGLEIIGKGNLPKKGPYIIVSNHVSYADPAVVGVACNTSFVTFMAKRELFEVPVFGSWVKAVGCIPIERYSGSPAPLKKAVKKLKAGGVLGMFPEGTRSPDGSFRKAQPGIGIIVLKSGAPVIPCYIEGSREALPVGKKWPVPHKIRATIGKPVDIPESLALGEKRKVYESVGEKVMEAISRLKK